MIEAFIKGILLALGLVIPLGPQNAFIFNQSTLQSRYRTILPVVLVSALCDAALIVLAVFGIDLLFGTHEIRFVISILGASFLAFWGCKMWKASQDSSSFTAANNMPRMQQIFFTLSVSLLNPHAILDTFLVIGTVSACYIGIEKHAFTAACIITDIAWFVFLSLSGFYIKKFKHGVKIAMSINKISAILMWYIAAQIFVELYFTIYNKSIQT